LHAGYYNKTAGSSKRKKIGLAAPNNIQHTNDIQFEYNV